MFHYGFAVARSILHNQDNLALRQPEPLTVVLFAHASVMFSLQDYINNYTRVSEAKQKKKSRKSAPFIQMCCRSLLGPLLFFNELSSVAVLSAGRLT